MRNLLAYINTLLFILTVQLTFAQTYVTIENGEFRHNGQKFTPVVMNYGINYRTDGSDLWAVPAHGYGSTNDIECNGLAHCTQTIKADFQLLKDKGFNTIRLVGVRPHFNSANQLVISAVFTSNATYQTGTEVPIHPNYTDYLDAVSDVVSAAEEVGLKIIYLVRGSFDEPVYDEFLQTVYSRFKFEPTIFAYDLLNEPLYEDKTTTSKSEVCSYVSSWKAAMNTYAPNQLMTIGFANSGEIQRWDPNLLPIDFASFHPYGSKEHVINEIYYYGKYINIPWIIGETGLAADNIEVSYSEQTDFARETMKKTAECGGQGYSWWQYGEVHWGSYQQDHLGLVNHSGTTATSDPNLTIEGTPKPAMNEFSKYTTYTAQSCPQPENFYTETKSYSYILKGKLINGNTSSSIAGGVITAWSHDWKAVAFAISETDGTFTLYTDVKMVHIKVSAPGMGNLAKTVSWSTTTRELKDGTLAVGATASVKTTQPIEASNYTVKGNGTSGGNLTLRSGHYIAFKDGFGVEKGGVLNADPYYHIGDLKIYPMSPCAPQLKSGTETADQETAESKAFESEALAVSANVFPNPTDGILNISSNYSISNLLIINNEGRVIYEEAQFSDNIIIDLSDLPKGGYQAVIYSNGERIIKSFILK